MTAERTTSRLTDHCHPPIQLTATRPYNHRHPPIQITARWAASPSPGKETLALAEAGVICMGPYHTAEEALIHEIAEIFAGEWQ